MSADPSPSPKPRPSKAKIAAIAAGALLLALFVASQAQFLDLAPRPQVTREPAADAIKRFGIDRASDPRRPAPAIELATLDGSRVSLAAARGQVVFVNFWATWC